MQSTEIVATYARPDDAARAIDLLARQHFAPDTVQVFRPKPNPAPGRRLRILAVVTLGVGVASVALVLVLFLTSLTTSIRFTPFDETILGLIAIVVAAFVGVFGGTLLWLERPSFPFGSKRRWNDRVEVRLAVPKEREAEARGLLASTGASELSD